MVYVEVGNKKCLIGASLKICRNPFYYGEFTAIKNGGIKFVDRVSKWFPNDMDIVNDLQ